MAFRDFSDLSDELRLSGGEAALLLIIPDPGTDKDLVVDLLDQSTVLEGTDWSVCFGGGRTLLLVGRKTWASLIVSATRIYEIYSVLHPIRMAVCRLDGWPCDYATAWQRALDADEVLNHAQNSIAYGIYDLRMQRLTPIGIERSRAAAVQSAMELYQRGLHLEAGFVLFEGFSTSELRVAWLRDILQLCEETLPKLSSIGTLIQISANPDRWTEARDEFCRVRDHLLNTWSRPKAYAVGVVVELCAKAIFNESMSPQPFDRDTGWHILTSAIDASGGRKGVLSEPWMSVLLGH